MIDRSRSPFPMIHRCRCRSIGRSVRTFRPRPKIFGVIKAWLPAKRSHFLPILARPGWCLNPAVAGRLGCSRPRSANGNSSWPIAIFAWFRAVPRMPGFTIARIEPSRFTWFSASASCLIQPSRPAGSRCRESGPTRRGNRQGIAFLRVWPVQR
jgi:hypothetical protein